MGTQHPFQDFPNRISRQPFHHLHFTGELIRGDVFLPQIVGYVRATELLAFLPIVERIDSHTIRFVGEDMPEVSRFLAFVLDYRVDITP